VTPANRFSIEATMTEAIRKALEPFAKLAPVLDHFDKDDTYPICRHRINGERSYGPTAGDCRRARELLQEIPILPEPQTDSGLLDAMVTFCGDWQQANPGLSPGLERDGKMLAALLSSGLIPNRAEIVQAERDACVSAALKAGWGAPSMWGSLNPRGWHLDRVCTPTDASMHDNGTVDAAKAVRMRGAT
jgi:hypothetical protein